METDETWTQWSKHVLNELQRLDRDLRELNKSLAENHNQTMNNLDKVKNDVLTLKTRASVWGVIAGGLMSCVTAVVYWILTKGAV